ncbi:oxysterol-binding protein-related protein 3 isoform X1 [Daphnia magna]|nr:oxysterol-binding protein-related protein 3 isoform X1 [Daphnia magna]XP_045028641.1 oxysterol-binding protein-related protein 3 isoform X1 [Daphnia magna]
MSGLRQIATEPESLDSKALDGKMERSPRLRHHTKSHSERISDSELSTETNSLSAESNNENGRSPVKSTPSGLDLHQQVKTKQRRRGAEWEIIDSFKNLQGGDQVPSKLEGVLLKKRKWPLKGWHKRYFVLDKGSLMYAKRSADLARGKPHGSVDLGLSVISAKRRRCRIDIDAEVFIYHIKVKSREEFGQWLEALKEHRQFRQQQLQSREAAQKMVASPVLSPCNRDEMSPTGVGGLHVSTSFGTAESLMPMSREGSLMRNLKPSRANMLLSESSAALEQLNNDIVSAQERLIHLVKCAGAWSHSSDSQSTTGNISPATKKDRKKFVLRRKKNKSNTSTNSAEPPASASMSESESANINVALNDKHSPLSCSIPSLSPSINGSSATEMLAPPMSDCNMLSPTDPGHDFLNGAQDLIGRLTTCLRTLNHERERLKLVIETATETSSISSRNGATLQRDGGVAVPSMVASLRCALHMAVQQNNELRARLQKIRSEAEVAIEGPNLTMSLELDLNASARLGHHSLSYSSSCVSQSEFFDAKEYLTDVAASDSSSDASETEMEGENEAEEEGSVSEASEMGNEASNDPESPEPVVKCTTGRRTKLPAPKPSTEDLSLWNLMKRNIGKDLSKVSMPVVLNEPIGMLQRLSEELEYSELLDKASETEDPYERMVLIAAFAVSAYGSSHVRAGHKPFNPLLGETYECVREDKGFKYISEQVSHHPPISACYASSENFEFWQDIRIKTKFWGKSMEFQPLGTVNVRLPRYEDHYRWNKVTTCVHNLFGGQRWVDQYGDLIITNNKGIRCKLNFAKASYWSSNRYEVVGSVTDPDGKLVHHLFGKWCEGLYCGVAPSARCVWRPGALPEDHEHYYGFSRFAIELNDLELSLVDVLPSTDSRFRPDQRLLEEGNVPGAEASKLQLEQAQRERRITNEQRGIKHQPRWFRCTASDSVADEDGEKWEFAHTYWDARAQSKFRDMNLIRLW